MGAIVWVVPEATDLPDRLTVLLGDMARVTHARSQVTGDLPAPRLILIECNYHCCFERCSSNFRLILRFPGIPVCIFRAVLSNHSGGLNKAYLATRLGSFSEESSEILSDYLAQFAKPSDHDRAFQDPASVVFRLQHHIVVAPAKTCTLSELADTARRSKPWLAKYFRRVTGVSPKAFINTIRLCHCLLDLIRSDHPVKRIALDYGYSPPHFSHIFHNKFGRWPSKVRSMHDKTHEAIPV